jgi:hypothetical protein
MAKTENQITGKHLTRNAERWVLNTLALTGAGRELHRVLLDHLRPQARQLSDHAVDVLGVELQAISVLADCSRDHDPCSIGIETVLQCTDTFDRWLAHRLSIARPCIRRLDGRKVKIRARRFPGTTRRRPMTVQAMFYVKEINHRATNDASAVNVEVKLAAAFGTYLKGLPEANGNWSKWTPTGELAMTITNPAAIAQFEIGGVYALTFEKVG